MDYEEVSTKEGGGDARLGSAFVDLQNACRRPESNRSVVPLEARHSSQPMHSWPPASVRSVKGCAHAERESWTEDRANECDTSSFSLKDIPTQPSDRRQSLESRPPS